MRVTVTMFAAAMVNSSSVPPIDPLRMLFASQHKVLTRSTNRILTPRIRKIARVAKQDPITGSHPAALLANAKPKATFTRTNAAARNGERTFRDRKERVPDTNALAEAQGLPSRKKWTA